MHRWKAVEVKIHLIKIKHIINEYLKLDKIKNRLKQYCGAEIIFERKHSQKPKIEALFWFQ